MYGTEQYAERLIFTASIKEIDSKTVETFLFLTRRISGPTATLAQTTHAVPMIFAMPIFVHYLRKKMLKFIAIYKQVAHVKCMHRLGRKCVSLDDLIGKIT